MVKNYARALENAARGLRPRAALSAPRSQFFTIWTDPEPANNIYVLHCKGQNVDGKQSKKTAAIKDQNS